MDPTYHVQPGQRRHRNTCATPGCRGTAAAGLDGLCDSCYQARLASTPVPVHYGLTWEEYAAMTPAQRRTISGDDRPDPPTYPEDYREELRQRAEGGPG